MSLLEEKDFLERLSKFKLNEVPLFNIKQLKDIDKTPCKQSTLEVIDFDDAKEKIVKYCNLYTLASCDCLKLDYKNYIDFIELKSIVKILEWNKEYLSNPEKLEEKINNLNLSEKIIDSYNLLSVVLNKVDSQLLPKDRYTFNNIKKRYFIVFDLELLEEKDSRIFISNSFNLLSIKNTIKKAIEDSVKNAQLLNLGDPIMTNCKKLHSYYRD